MFYFPISLEQGLSGWAVAYENHRNEIIPVLTGCTQSSAVAEASRMTAQAARQALNMAGCVCA